MTIERPNNSSDSRFNDGQLARDIPYTGRAPYEVSRDAEDQRQEVIALVKKHADDINRAALKNNVPPETIAGAILWEAIENHKPWFLNTKVLGRVHFENAVTLYKDGRVPYGFTPFDLGKPVVAIEYIAAIMNESAENYERIVGIDIRNNVGVLNTLYHGGNSQGRAEKLRDERKIDIANKKAPRPPRVPEKEMGEYVEKYRRYIRTSLLGLNLTKKEPGNVDSNMIATQFSNQLAASELRDSPIKQQTSRNQFTTATSQASNSNLSEALSMLDKMKGGNSSSFTSASSSHNPDIAAGLNILDQIKKDLQSDKEPAFSNIADKDPVAPSKSRDNGIGGR